MLKYYMQEPIGVFDSGIGGLTVVKHLFLQLPLESIVYFGDTARVPYGSKSIETIRRYALESTRFMMTHQAKFIVVACNTTSAVALEDIRSIYQYPVIGVIEPGASAAVKATRNKVIGVIGTKATIRSEAYPKAIHQLDASIKVISKPCPLFVPLVEEGLFSGAITESVIRLYIEPLIAEGIDTLVLGCTHYPLLRASIQKVVGDSIRLIDSGKATAAVVKELMMESNLQNKDAKSLHHQFYVSDSVGDFERLGSAFLEKQIPPVNKAEVEYIVSLGKKT